MAADPHTMERERSLRFVRECYYAMQENESAMWINAEFAFRCGATLAQIAAVTDTHTDTARKRLARVRGRV